MRRSIAVAMVGVALASTALAKSYGGHTPTAIEQARLPTYCYPWFVDEKYFGQPGYSIPQSCGVYMNHFCPGLLLLMRAEKVTDPPSVRKSNARRAIKDIEYTKSGMTPGCPLKNDVEAALAKARAIEKYVR